MMDALNGLALGFAQAATLQNLALTVGGCFLGTWIGMMPGLGPAAGIALLLPLTYGMDPTSALILFCGVYLGSMYGGSITSILINMPGDASAVMTTLDGSPMAQKGRAGAALFLSAIASFVGGTISIVGLTLLAPTISRMALSFGPAEYSALMLFALIGVVSFMEGAVVRGMISVMMGLLLGTVGIDLQSGSMRFTFNEPELLDGISIMAVIVGIYSVSEAIEGIHKVRTGNAGTVSQYGKLLASKEEWLRSRWAMVRGGIIGFVVGVLPGAGATIATFISYATEYRLSKYKDEFGKGAPEGVAGPEAANNASASGAMVPLLTLGIPGSGTTAVMLGALMIYGIQPGPKLFTEHANVAWGVIASLYVSNVILVIMNVPLVGLFVRLLKIEPLLLNVGILVLAIAGVYVVNLSFLEAGLTVVFGALGFFMRRLGFPTAPLILGLTLSALIEQSLRQALVLDAGSWMSMIQRPLVLTILVASAAVLLLPRVAFIFAWAAGRFAAKGA
jgi:putative tricarboxylic transport membrane protein